MNLLSNNDVENADSDIYWPLYYQYVKAQNVNDMRGES